MENLDRKYKNVCVWAGGVKLHRFWESSLIQNKLIFKPATIGLFSSTYLLSKTLKDMKLKLV